jgi:hypothetical protein
MEFSSRIKTNINRIFSELPEGVALEAAAKERNADEVISAIEAGVGIIGENYLQEALDIYDRLGDRAEWHFIGHLQRNKVKKAVKIFSMIETLDSMRLAEEIDKRCAQLGRKIDVLVEINSGVEDQKFGILPGDVCEFVEKAAKLPNIVIRGLMTMGPFTGDPVDARPYFRRTREVFSLIKDKRILNASFDTLSMGMSATYKVAVEEGATLVRIGTGIFGDRQKKA